MTPLDGVLLLLCWLGSFAFCVAAFNRLHAIGISRRFRRKLEILLILTLPLLSLFYLWRVVFAGASLMAALTHPADAFLFLAFPVVCWTTLLLAIPYWLVPRLISRRSSAWIATASQRIDVQQEIGEIEVHGRVNRWLARLPGNEIFHLELCQKTLALPQLPPALQGLSIVHLSDLHFTGDLGQRFFDYVVDASNRLSADVLILSGDIIESVACEPWLEQTLGRLTARCGKYFVLGNHDLRKVQPARTRAQLTASGFQDLGGQAQLVHWNDCPILLAGDERPWFSGPTDAAVTQAAAAAAFRVLVAHTPDRYAWAKQHRFDLMFAGHNHGGQVRFPLIGPLVSPSLSGTRYSGGVYQEGPTLLHVSRGISGEHPLRWNCPPELAKLVLTTQ